MEPNVAQTSHAASRLLSLLALAAGLLIATYSAPVHAQDAVAPDNCATDATVHDDGDDMNGSDEDSVAVGCGANVQQTETTTGTDPQKQRLLTLDVGNDGTVDDYLLVVDCDTSEVGACAGLDGDQYVRISQALHDRLNTVGDDVAEMDGVRTAGPLTEAEMRMLTSALMNPDNVRPLSDIAFGLNDLTDTGAEVMRPGSMTTNEVTGAVAVGDGAAVKANGGVAIGNGANVGTDEATTITSTMDGAHGGLVTGYESETTGGGGDNAIAIGNGASATGAGSIAIGNGAMATEDGQVVIGGHDIGGMADSVANNTAKIGANSDRIDSAMDRLSGHDRRLADHDERLRVQGVRLDELGTDVGQNTDRIMNNGERIDENRGMINSNTSKIDNNAERIDENRGMINSNTSRITNNATGINANTAMLGMHSAMIGNAMDRLDGHDTAMSALDARVVAHGATLAALDSRLDAHDQVLTGHAAGINNNAMQIEMLDERVSQVAAAAAALSAVPNAPDRDEQFFVGVGVGSHGGESSVAAGISGRLGANKNIVVNAGIASGGSGTSVRAGVGFSF